MNKQYQINVELGTGDCFGACVASILEIPLANLPYPNREKCSIDHFWDTWCNWLQEQGYDLEWKTGTPRGYSIGSVESPRLASNHSVVCLDGVLVHDPNPNYAEVAHKPFRGFYVLLPKEYPPCD